MKERLRKRQRERQKSTESRGRKRLGKSSNQSYTDLPSVESMPTLQVFIRRYEYAGEKQMGQLSCLTACLFIFLVLSWEINGGSGYSLNIYNNKLW